MQGVLPFQYEQEKRSTGMTGAVRPDYLLGVATRIRLEVIDRAPRRAARVWSGLGRKVESIAYWWWACWDGRPGCGFRSDGLDSPQRARSRVSELPLRVECTLRRVEGNHKGCPYDRMPGAIFHANDGRRLVGGAGAVGVWVFGFGRRIGVRGLLTLFALELTALLAS